MNKPAVSASTNNTIGIGILLSAAVVLANNPAHADDERDINYSILPAEHDVERLDTAFGLRSSSGLNFSFSRKSGEDEQARWGTSMDSSRSGRSFGGELPITQLHSGLTYSAGLVVESRDAATESSEFVSSRQLGVHYGRLGAINYSGVDLGVERISDAEQTALDDESLWSLGVTTGKRFAWTGLESSDPLWTLSLRGRFNYEASAEKEVVPDNQTWFFSPGLHWENDSFRMSADLLMPFMQMGEFEDEDNYSIRARIQKRF